MQHELSAAAPAGSGAPAMGAPRRAGSAGAAWRLGTVAGIPIDVHITFALLLAWVALSHFMQGHGLATMTAGVLLVVSIFACVVLHELSHALVARRFGIRTRAITLLPIGGVAQLEHMPERPAEEFAVAVVGPAASLLIAAAIYAGLRLFGGPVGAEPLHLVGGPFFTKLMWINLGLAMFNLLPAFPMDGGRVLRAALALRLGRVRATEVAAVIGQSMAILFGVVGLASNPILVLIAVFVWVGAKSEATLVEVKSMLSELPVMQAMRTELEVLSPRDPLARAVELALAGFQQDFPVMEHGHVVGVLTRAATLKGLSESGPNTEVETSMTREFETAAPWEPLDKAFERLQGSECSALVVVQDGVPVGLLTPESIGQLLMFRQSSGVN